MLQTNLKALLNSATFLGLIDVKITKWQFEEKTGFQLICNEHHFPVQNPFT